MWLVWPLLATRAPPAVQLFLGSRPARPASPPASAIAFDAAADDPRFRPLFPAILDLRAAHYEAEFADGEAFVGALRRRMDDFRGGFALVVPKSLRGLAQLYAVLAKVGGYDAMKSFLDMDEALAWSGRSG